MVGSGAAQAEPGINKVAGTGVMTVRRMLQTVLARFNLSMEM